MAWKLIDVRVNPLTNKDHNEFICDTDADFADLPKCNPGDTAVSAATRNVYIVNASGNWVLFGGGGDTVLNDTLTVDLNTFVPKVVADTSEPGSAGLVKVSDVVPTLDDFVNGGTITYKHWQTGEMVEETFSYDLISDMYDNFGCVTDSSSHFVVAPYDNFTVEIVGWATFTFPEKGVYFIGGCTASLTINGFNGF